MVLVSLRVLSLGLARNLIARFLGQVMMDLEALGLAIEAAQVARVRVVKRLAATAADIRRLTVRVLAYGMGQCSFLDGCLISLSNFNITRN
jgi:hypothetical protein